MQTTKFLKIEGPNFGLVVAMLLSLMVFGSCSGGGGGGSSTSAGNPAPAGASWQQTSLTTVDATGLLSARVKVIPDPNGQLHIVHYNDSGDDNYPYAIEYSVWDGSTLRLIAPAESQVVTAVDNSLALDFAMDSNGTPVVAYQGGAYRECGDTEQSDVMISLAESGSWYEYLGAMGFVERNPVFKDGLAGADAEVAVDSNGDVHLIYQFYYEGCDAMNHTYPDLLYVKRERSLLSDESITEETIEGNIYVDFGTGIQNSVGYHCELVLDADENPVAFYAVKTAFDQTYGLRVARRSAGGTWQLDWVEEDCEVVAISAARSEVDDTLAVAYAVKENDGFNTVYYLKYAQLINDTWVVEMVDDSVSCGSYCSLAFNSGGQPAIAYYEIKSHTGYTLQNLKFAQMIGHTWETERVAAAGDIGKYNNLWFDGNDQPRICSYAATHSEIVLFEREQEL